MPPRSLRLIEGLSSPGALELLAQSVLLEEKQLLKPRSSGKDIIVDGARNERLGTAVVKRVRRRGTDRRERLKLERCREYFPGMGTGRNLRVSWGVGGGVRVER